MPMTNANLYGTGGTSEDLGRTALREREKDPTNRPKKDKLAARYRSEVARYNSAASNWYEEGDNIVKVYMNEATTASPRRFALLWANIETLKPAVYTKLPIVQCSRRYKDRDPVARTAAELAERATNTTFELYNVDEVLRMVRDDRLLVGRGTAWVRYEASFEEVEETSQVFDPETGLYVDSVETYDRLADEQACVDYVHWQDFGHNVARTWSDVWLVWRWVYKTQDEVEDRFGEDKAATLSYSTKPPGGGGTTTIGDDGGMDDCARILELWDKRRKLVSWLADGQDEFLESGPPPVNFSTFFPTPEPTYATKTSKSLIPRPDYIYYRDQAKEINDLTDKIGRMTEWLVVKGFIPGGPSGVADPLEEVIRDKSNRELFAQIPSMAEWTDKGGTKGLIDWLPLQPIIEAIQAAIAARSQLLQDVFQISGIGDVLRGQTDPDETFGAVEIRAQTGSRRLRNTKDDIARFCRDIGRLTAEVISENFQPESIAAITGFKYEPEPEMILPGLPNMTNVSMFPGAQMPMLGNNGGPAMDDPNDEEPGLTFSDKEMALLRSDKLRSFRIDVETDSTVQADENADKRQRIEVMAAAGQYMERMATIIQAAPEFAPTAGELLMYTMRGFRAGRSLEETIERDFKKLVAANEAKRNAPPQEDPVIQVAKVQVAGEIEKNRTNAALKAEEIKTDALLEKRDQDIDMQVAIRGQDMTAATKARESATRTAQRIMGGGGMVPPRQVF